MISPLSQSLLGPTGAPVSQRASLNTLLDRFGGIYIADTTARSTTNVAMSATIGLVAGLITSATHGLVVNQAFQFTNLYGSAISVTSIVAGLVLTGAAHGMQRGQSFTFTALTNAAGGAAAATTYYVATVPGTTTLTYALVRDGSPTTGHSADSGTFRGNALIADKTLAIGKTFYAKTVPSGTTLTFSETPGGTAIVAPDVVSGNIAAIGWAGFIATEIAVASLVTCAGLAGTTTSVTIPASNQGLRFPGGATAVTLASGKGILIHQQ